nr:MAG TPA: hypothetical protein [Caudoviricetes sp.]
MKEINCQKNLWHKTCLLLNKNPHWRYVVTFADNQKTNHSAKLWKILN